MVYRDGTLVYGLIWRSRGSNLGPLDWKDAADHSVMAIFSKPWRKWQYLFILFIYLFIYFENLTQCAYLQIGSLLWVQLNSSILWFQSKKTRGWVEYWQTLESGTYTSVVSFSENCFLILSVYMQITCTICTGVYVRSITRKSNILQQIWDMFYKHTEKSLYVTVH